MKTETITGTFDQNSFLSQDGSFGVYYFHPSGKSRVSVVVKGRQPESPKLIHKICGDWIISELHGKQFFAKSIKVIDERAKTN